MGELKTSAALSLRGTSDGCSGCGCDGHDGTLHTMLHDTLVPYLVILSP